METKEGKKTRRVVIAMDGSEHSHYAFKWYLTKLRLPGDFLSLLHFATYENMSYGAVSLFPGDPSIVEKIINTEEKRISEFIDKLGSLLQENGIEGEVLRLSGEHAGQVLLKKAEELQADMIVTGSRGLGTVRRTVLGSISDYIIHHAHVPVVVCKHVSHHKHGHHDSHPHHHK
ncbi:hypothetical protein FSP39_003513 [Pinctada imbricata]|uniref:UspA domain-containing protein n=1 Tax=Pinctada imbricata TaxID=66713 RepID=A0AA89BZT6_PINIB|nr:hypothetical protein FSP39_003513 [Pinctada imbricata]